MKKTLQKLATAMTLAVLINTQVAAQYCSPTMYPTNGCNYLNSVTTSGGITNITVPVDAGYNTIGYTFFNTAPVITQAQGSSFTLTVQGDGTCVITYFFVWVDWNMDFVFDPSEMVVDNGANNTGNTATDFVINVPPGCSGAGTTRIRILCRGIGSPIPATACDDESGYYGETEDYTLVILGGTMNTAQTFNMCTGSSVAVGANTYTSSGVYVDTLSGGFGCDSIVTTHLTVGNPLTSSQTMTLCAGDSLTVGASVYHSTGTFVNTLTAMGGCDSIVTSHLTVSPALGGSQTLSICNGSSISVGSYTHTTSGTFTDVITASTGCDSAVITHLTVQTPITGSQTLTICSGNSVTVGSATHTNTGIFTDIITAHNGCDSTVTTNLTVNLTPVVVVNSPSICFGQTAYLTAGGAASYVWSPGVNATGVGTATAACAATTTFTVTGTTGLCSASAVAVVTVHPLPVVTIVAFNPSTVCIYWPAFTLPVATPASGVYSGAGASGTMFTPSVAGAGAHVITYTYTNSFNCTASAATTVNVSTCAGIDEVGFSNNVAVYPNPATGIFTIHITNVAFKELMLSITDMQGREVYALTDKKITADYSLQINPEGLAKGIYNIKLSNGTEVTVQKLVIQ